MNHIQFSRASRRLFQLYILELRHSSGSHSLKYRDILRKLEVCNPTNNEGDNCSANCLCVSFTLGASPSANSDKIWIVRYESKASPGCINT